MMSVIPGAAVPAKSTVPYRSPCTSWLGFWSVAATARAG
ncbi:hypothetical protein I553_0157 [Mycobacterium xenopi 4042]|uniref:Uncharacterized protein n=1 Tax=Mycobacterium xenopi 4042 TaxID=1299334 RepID=X7YKI3_MYCXE|nr:hypothetical protein I553_0157 [Mycobacterium xenopi 4042]